MRKSILLAVAALVLPVSPSAAAGAPPQPVVISVPHGDLDLTSPHDVSVLKRRIENAVTRACQFPGYSGSFVITDDKCRDDALEAALAIMERRRAVELAAAN